MAADDDRSALLRLAWRLDSLEQAQTALVLRLALQEAQLNELVKADEIAAAVAARLDETHSLHLTTVQRRLAIAAAVVTTLGGVGGITLSMLQLFAG